MKNIAKVMLLVVIVMTAVTVASAQEQPPQPTLTPEKRALIAELNEVTGGKKAAQDLVNVMMVEFEKLAPDMLSTSIENDQTLTASEKEEMRKFASETSARIFKKYKDLMSQRLDFGKVIEDISYPVYDKYFTETELRDLVAFYKSETGKKTIAVMPALFAETMQRTNAAIQPIMQQITKEVMDSEIQEVKKEIKKKGLKKS